MGSHQFLEAMNIRMVMFQDGQVEGVSTTVPVDRLAFDRLIERITYAGFVQAVQVCE